MQKLLEQLEEVVASMPDECEYPCAAVDGLGRVAFHAAPGQYSEYRVNNWLTQLVHAETGEVIGIAIG